MLSGEEIIKHNIFIRECLRTIDISRGTYTKAIGAKLLYDYLRVCAMDFVLEYKRFRDEVVSKAYGIKEEVLENTVVIKTIDMFLIELGCPLERKSEVTTVVQAQPLRRSERIAARKMKK